MTLEEPSGTDLFFETGSAEAAEEVLRALARAWPDTILTGLHYLVGHREKRYLVGASFCRPVTPGAVAAVAGDKAKLTELTLEEVFRRLSRKEFAVALFGDAGRMLEAEEKTDTRRFPTSEDVDAR